MGLFGTIAGLASSLLPKAVGILGRLPIVSTVVKGVGKIASKVPIIKDVIGAFKPKVDKAIEIAKEATQLIPNEEIRRKTQGYLDKGQQYVDRGHKFFNDTADEVQRGAQRTYDYGRQFQQQYGAPQQQPRSVTYNF